MRLSYNCPIWLSYICPIIVLWLSYSCVTLALHMLRTFLSPLTCMTSVTWKPRPLKAHSKRQCLLACWVRRLRMRTAAETNLAGIFEIRALLSVASRLAPAETLYTAVCPGPWLPFLARFRWSLAKISWGSSSSFCMSYIKVTSWADSFGADMVRQHSLLSWKLQWSLSPSRDPRPSMGTASSIRRHIQNPGHVIFSTRSRAHKH